MPRHSKRISGRLHPKVKREIKVPVRFVDNTSSASSFFTAPKTSVSPAHKGTPHKNTPKQLGAMTKRIDQRKKSDQSVLKALNIKTMMPEDYRASLHDKPHLFKVQTVNLLKDLHGQGLYASQDIPAEVCFGEYTGEVSSLGDYSAYLEETAEADPSYAMEVGGNIVDAIEKGNFTRFINFSDAQANAAFISGYVGHRKTVLLKTIEVTH